MGTTSSALSQLQDNVCLKTFSSPKSIKFNDPFWNQLLSFHFSPIKTNSEVRQLETSVAPILENLILNDLHSGNVLCLIQVFLVRATELKEFTQCKNDIFVWQTHNALFILRCILKYFIENVKEENVLDHFQVHASESSTESGDVKSEALSSRMVIEQFINALFEILIDVPVSTFSYALHVEVVNILLVLLSIQMYSTKPFSKSVIYKSVMQGKCAIHAFLVTKCLLQNFISQEKCPNYMNTTGGSIILDLASGLLKMLSLGFSHGNPEAEALYSQAILADRSLLLLLILVKHCASDKPMLNPYKEALLGFTNSEDPSSPSSVTAVPAFKLDYQKLFDSICATLNNEKTTLLLYILLHRNSSFKEFVLKTGNKESLVIPLLKVLYFAAEMNSHHIYMSLIVLLILSEDENFSKVVHEIVLKNVPWYSDRTIGEITLGSLLVLVVIRTIQFNMTRMRDKYLHTNCLAALANMSAYFRGLHCYVCQRLIGLLEHLAKRMQRVLAQIRRNSNDTKVDVDEDFSTDLMQDLSVLEEVLRMLLEILNCCITMQLSENPNLLYTLLYKRQVFDSFKSHPTFQDVVQNMDMVLTHFSECIEKAEQNLSVSEVSAIIQEAASTWPVDRLKKFPELKFKYIEEDQPEEFFIPYVWSLAYTSAEIPWNSQNITLFDPSTFVKE